MQNASFLGKLGQFFPSTYLHICFMKKILQRLKFYFAFFSNFVSFNAYLGID